MSSEKKILLVDDEESILELGRLMLEHVGYQVVTALDGETALEKYLDASSISVVVLDLSLPGMTGKQLLERILEHNPGQKIIVSSGHDNRAVTEELSQLGAVGFLPKPYRIESIVSKIEEVIGSEKMPHRKSSNDESRGG